MGSTKLKQRVRQYWQRILDLRARLTARHTSKHLDAKALGRALNGFENLQKLAKEGKLADLRKLTEILDEGKPTRHKMS